MIWHKMQLEFSQSDTDKTMDMIHTFTQRLDVSFCCNLIDMQIFCKLHV